MTDPVKQNEEDERSLREPMQFPATLAIVDAKPRVGGMERLKRVCGYLQALCGVHGFWVIHSTGNKRRNMHRMEEELNFIP